MLISQHRTAGCRHVHSNKDLRNSCIVFSSCKQCCSCTIRARNRHQVEVAWTSSHGGRPWWAADALKTPIERAIGWQQFTTIVCRLQSHSRRLNSDRRARGDAISLGPLARAPRLYARCLQPHADAQITMIISLYCSLVHSCAVSTDTRSGTRTQLASCVRPHE